MIKKLIYGAASMAILLSACSNEPMEPATGDGNVVLQLSLPASMQTRAFSNGLSATNLQYAVYEAGTKELVTTNAGKNDVTFTDLHATVTLKLVNGKSYDFIFWAQSPDASCYALDTEKQTITVNYDPTPVSNDETRDAFFGNLTAREITGPTTIEATLYRPFAQINLGTDDFNEDAVKKAYTDLTTTLTTTAYTGFNLMSGDVTGDAVQVTFAAAAAPENQTFPVEGYDYVSMNYLLVGAQKEIVNVKYSLMNAGTEVAKLNLSDVPVQRNYRTNIYGSVFTSPATLNIDIEPDYNTPGFDISLGPWDGETVTTPYIDEEAKTITVGPASDLAGLAELINEAAADTYNGYTIQLNNDIDMGGNAIAPIGKKAKRSGSTITSGNSFVIDGQGHTISNVKIDNTGLGNDNAAALFASLSGENSAIRNLTIENIEIEAGLTEQAGVVGMVTNGAKVENVHVLGGKLSGTEGIGLVGRMMRSGTVSNCSNAADITATSQNVGGIVGAAYYNSTTARMTIENCTNKGNITSGNVSAGGIAGLSAADVKGCVNYGTITCSNNSVGGIVGGIYNSGVISDCENHGDVINNGTSIGAGGIVGWIRYMDSKLSYPLVEPVRVVGCKNHAAVKGGSSAGGIVGHWYKAGEISGCTNSAPSITATAQNSFAAGIVGTSQFPEVFGPDGNLVISGNTSTTPLDKISAIFVSPICYVNTPDKVTLSGNTPDQD